MSKNVIFDKKNILVIGGAGFIGSHLCDELVKENKVICIDNFITGSEKNIDHLLADPNFVFINHDITQPIDLNNLPELQNFKIQFQGIQEIYNLACPTSPKYFNENKILTALTNSYGIKNILDLTIQYQSKLLHLSSSVVYGILTNDDDRRIREDYIGGVDPMSSRSAYDEGKRFAETMIINYAEKFNIDIKIIRLFRVYGPRMKLDDGQMLPDFVNSALDNRDLVIHGDENFSSALCYISDCVDAITQIMDTDVKGPINIGSDVKINLTDLANKVIAMVGATSQITYGEELIFMKPLSLPDISKARNELGWMPVVSIDKGLENTIYELRANKGLKGVQQSI